MKTALVIAALALVSVPAVTAAFEVPTKACAYLSDVGLGTRGWKNDYDDEYHCSSPYKEIGPGSPLANNLAYYVEGSRGAVKRLKLVVNINNRVQQAAALSELQVAAKLLASKILGVALPSAAINALKSGTQGSWKVGQNTVSVKRDNWPTGKGYEIHFVIE